MVAVAATSRVVIYIDTGDYEGVASRYSVSEYILLMESIEALRRKEALAHRPSVLSYDKQASKKANSNKVYDTSRKTPSELCW